MTKRHDFEISVARTQAEVERARTLIAEGASDLEGRRLIDGDTFMDEWRREIEEFVTPPGKSD